MYGREECGLTFALPTPILLDHSTPFKERIPTVDCSSSMQIKETYPLTSGSVHKRKKLFIYLNAFREKHGAWGEWFARNIHPNYTGNRVM